MIGLEHHILGFSVLGVMIVITLWMARLWARDYGIQKALCLWILRWIWLVPLVTTLFPRNIAKSHQKTQFESPVVAVWIDDSDSMKTTDTLFKSSPFERAITSTATLQAYCQTQNCTVSVTKGSESDQRFTEGYSPLRAGLKQFLATSAQIHIIFTDGGAHKPQHMSREQISQLTHTDHNSKIIVVTEQGPEPRNISLDQLHSEPFGFTTTHHQMSFEIHRSEISLATQTIQVKVDVDGQTVSAQNFSFEPHTQTLKATLTIPLLKAGVHHIELSSLPLPEEYEHWDNHLETSVEILRHSSGVLHLLGSPNSDGRFLRRFLKLDPRFETLSFFILRDPWDLPTPDQRSISLIPFPVDQLFTEELPYFSIVIMQNFRMSQFLQPDHGQRLIDYVKNGGSLLFIGGPRSLHLSDIHYSALRGLLPFEISESLTQLDNQMLFDQSDNTTPHPNLPTYDQQSSYTIQMSDLSSWPLSPATSLADELTALHAPLSKITLRGIHRTDHVTFKDTFSPDNSQSLHTLHLSKAVLNHTNPHPQHLPLISASFFGKGRVIWIFSDSLWQIAMTDDPSLPRNIYNTLMSQIFRWLSRDEKTPPLTIEHFEVSSLNHQMDYMLRLYGPGVKVLNEPSVDLKITICDTIITDPHMIYLSDKLVEIRSSHSQSSSPTFNHSPPTSTSICHAQVSAEHPKMGQEKAQAITKVQVWQTDQSFKSSPTLIKRLIQGLPATASTHLNLINTLEQIRPSSADSSDWSSPGARKRPRMDNHSHDVDHYWAFDFWWLWLLFGAMPIEVWLRQMHQNKEYPKSVLLQKDGLVR